jgi:nucleoid DNA-binding protein
MKDKLDYLDKIYIGYTFNLVKKMAEDIKGKELTKKELKDLIKKFAEEISKELK